MANRLSWKYVAEAIGVSAIVVSLVFVGLQMQQTQSIALSEVMTANVGHRIEANIAIAEHSVLWDKANSGEKLSSAEAVLIDRLIDNVSIERVAIWLHYQELGREQTAELILTDYAGFLYRNPGIYQRWLEREKKFVADRTALLGAEYSLDGWLDGMRERVEKLKSAGEEY